MSNGVDVYSGDGKIDWAKVKAAGYEFAFVKASQGTTIHDARHSVNIKGAWDAGVMVGSYHFFLATSNAADQAKFFLDCVGDMEGQILPVIDAESHGGMTNEQYSASVQVWLDVVEAAISRKPIIYCSRDYAMNWLTPTFGEYPLWLAQWTLATPSGKVGGWDNWTFWQNAANATVPGLPNHGDTDIDKFDGTMVDLGEYVIGADLTTPVKVVDHGTGALIETLQMVPGGDHIVDQGKLYVKR